MAAQAPAATIGWLAPDFRLLGTDGKHHRLQDLRGPKGTVIVFMCNHCPYVRAILPRLLRDASELAAHGVHTVGINANDDSAYPEDSYAHMQALAQELALPFPYLHDPSQNTARAYGAVCTPDFFGFNAALQLQYRGRLDASRKEQAPEDSPRELYEAMRMIASTGQGPAEQHAGIGCSIKWR